MSKGVGPWDIRPVRIAALAALARNNASSASLVAAIDVAPVDMATGTLADWLVAIEKTPGVRGAPALRTAAEMENLRRRTARDVQDARSYAIANFARDMLSVSDNLARTLEAIPAEAKASGDAGF